MCFLTAPAYFCRMDSGAALDDKKPRKPLLSIEAEAAEKQRFQLAAKQRRITLSALARELLHAECDRLGIK